MGMSENLVQTFEILFSWPNILYPILGTLVAMVVSFLPGIGMSAIATFFLLLTIDWPIDRVLLLFGALVGGATFMGSVTGILFNIPGSTPSAAILFDGYPLSQRGYTRRALAAAATASAVGSLLGVLVLLLCLPLIKPYLVLFGPMERFLVALWGILSVVLTTRGQLLAGVFSALLGLFIAMVGTDLQTGHSRLTFGLEILNDGIHPIIFLMGFFSLAEIIHLQKNILKDKSPKFVSQVDDTIFSGVKAVFQNKILTLKSSLIGVTVGMMPGAGGTVASLIAYSSAASSKYENANFGRGDIRGVIAPEASVDAKDGGSLLPAILLGLPGSEVGIILVSLFVIHGLIPGSVMLESQLTQTYTLIFALLFSNLLTSAVGLLLINQFIKLKSLNYRFLVAPIVVTTIFLVYQINESWIDVISLFIFGLLGLLFTHFAWPKVPLVVAFVLGQFLESNFYVSVQLIELSEVAWSVRMPTLTMFGLIVLSLGFFAWRRHQETSIYPLQPLIILLTITGFFCVAMMFFELSTYTIGIMALWGIFALTVLIQFLTLMFGKNKSIIC
jgi:TctA family transporter